MMRFTRLVCVYICPLLLETLYGVLSTQTRARRPAPQVHVVKGALVCPKSGRRFPINNGIPNMLLHEDEV